MLKWVGLILLLMVSLSFSAAAITCMYSPCVAGSDLIKSRDNLPCSWDPFQSCAEPNQPNTVDGCADGNLYDLGYQYDESIENITITDPRGVFYSGDTVTVTVNAFCYDGRGAIRNWVALYYDNGSGWKYVNVQGCTVSGDFQTFTFTLPLDAVSGVHNIRAVIYWGFWGSALFYSCGSDITGYSDTDDVSIYVRVPGVPVLDTDKDNYTNCGEVFYKVETYDKNFGPVNDSVSIEVYDPLGNLVVNQLLSTANGIGYGSFLLPYESFGLWKIVARASCPIFQKSFFVGFGDGLWKVELSFDPAKTLYNRGETVTIRALVIDGHGLGVEGANVTLNVNGFSYSMSDNGKGYYSYPLLLNTSGKYNVKVIAQYGGDNVENSMSLWVE